MENEKGNDTSYLGTLGMTKRGTQRYVNITPGNSSLAEIQK